MRRFLILLLIPSCLLGCLERHDDPRDSYSPHFATSWRLTPVGILRDAGPFGSVSGGYITEEEIDNALDLAHFDFVSKFPEFAWVNPYVHLTDDYVFFLSVYGAWVSGYHMGDNQIAISLWTRGKSVEEPTNCWIKRAPGDSFGTYYDYWRYTAFPLIPAYQHECLHVAIGDPGHTSSYWSRL